MSVNNRYFIFDLIFYIPKLRTRSLFTDPPSTPPAITGYGAGYTVVTGDNLTCSVNGGRPLVSRVIFSCFSASDVINDQPDVTLSTSVTSSVIIPTQNTNVLTCACRADWSPRLEAYPWNTTVNIQVLCNNLDMLMLLTLHFTDSFFFLSLAFYSMTHTNIFIQTSTL